MAESMRDKACKSPGVSQLTLASSAGASDAEAALVDFSLSWPVSALALCGIGKRSIRLPRGPPTCSGMTPLPWSVLAPSASVRICCRLSVLRAAISHSTRNKHISARQKSAKATFHAPPCSSCLCLPPPRLTMVCSCALLSCGFSTATSAARGFLRLAVAAFEVVDPAFQLGEARLDVERHQAAPRVDRQQRRLAGHVGHQHHLDAFLVRRFLVDQLLHHVADRVDDAVAKKIPMKVPTMAPPTCSAISPEVAPSLTVFMVMTMPSTAARMPKPGIASAILPRDLAGCSSSSWMAASSCSSTPSSSWALILPMAIRRKLSTMKASSLGSSSTRG